MKTTAFVTVPNDNHEDGVEDMPVMAVKDFFSFPKMRTRGVNLLMADGTTRMFSAERVMVRRVA